MITFTKEQLVAAGGKYWESSDGGKRRVYFNDLEWFAGLEVNRYGTGNISSASYRGSKISNTKAAKLSGQLSLAKVHYDLTTDKFDARGGDPDLINTVVEEIVRAATTATDPK